MSIDGLHLYRPGDEDTTEQMHRHLSAYIPMYAQRGLPVIDDVEPTVCNSGCCFLLELHDGVNDKVHVRGPFKRDAITNVEAMSDLVSMIARIISAPFN